MSGKKRLRPAKVALMQDSAMVRAYVRAADGDIPSGVEDRAWAIVWVIQYLNHFQTESRNDGDQDIAAPGT
jgi:hypothetical protein